MAGGDRPAELATFIGYLVTAALMLPLAVVLSFMERTRWGAVIAGVAALTVAVLVLRLQQTWTPLT
jgi:thiamine transporter ThiT